MGRGHESEVRVNDISVSRCHAILKYKPDGVYIEDNRSKFGTLVLLKEHYNMQLEYTSAVQVGRTVVSFTVRNTNVESMMGSNKEQNAIFAGAKDLKSEGAKKDLTEHNDEQEEMEIDG
jgi:hypothetical protein